MKLKSILLAGALAITSIMTTAGSSTHAALPCNVLDPLPATASVASPPPAPDQPVTLIDALHGDEPADREGAVRVTSEDPHALRFNLVAAGENVLRCLDYGSSTVLLLNSTSGFRAEHLGWIGEPETDYTIVEDPKAGVYTESVDNPLRLTNGDYLVDFRATLDGVTLVGEFVFQEINGDLYLADSYLFMHEQLAGETYTVTVTETGVTEEISVRNGDRIHFDVEIVDSARITIVSDETGEVVFSGSASHDSYVGGAPHSTFSIIDMEPGTYTATLAFSESDDPVVVIITVEP